MAFGHWFTRIDGIGKWLLMSGVTLSLSLSSSALSAFEIKASISKVDDDGKLELSLPNQTGDGFSEGTVVEIGNEVRVEAILPGLEPAAIKTRWIVTAVKDDVVMAEPEGKPTSHPEVGFDAIIDTGSKPSTLGPKRDTPQSASKEASDADKTASEDNAVSDDGPAASTMAGQTQAGAVKEVENEHSKTSDLAGEQETGMRQLHLRPLETEQI